MLLLRPKHVRLTGRCGETTSVLLLEGADKACCLLRPLAYEIDMHELHSRMDMLTSQRVLQLREVRVPWIC